MLIGSLVFMLTVESHCRILSRENMYSVFFFLIFYYGNIQMYSKVESNSILKGVF